MLREALDFILTPCPPWARRFGFRMESVALVARWRRQREAWAPHISAARAFITRAADQCPVKNRVAIIGSGPLIEIPLSTLAHQFAEVVLVDVVHPPIARWVAGRNRNVRLITADVTGILDRLRSLLDSERAWPLPPPTQGPALGPFDLAISCNLLSQLPVMVVDAMSRRAVPEDEIQTFAAAIIRHHITWLKRNATIAALFTDTEVIRYDLAGGQLAREPTLWSVPMPPPDHAWDWFIAPAPEEERATHIHRTVHAWSNLNGQILSFD